MPGPLLSITHLRTYFHLDEGVLKAVDDINLDLQPGQTLGIVGESGSSAKAPQPAVLREPDGSLLVRGSTAIRDVEELLGVRFGRADDTVTTIAGLLSHISGKVLASGDRAELEGYRFEVLEANQRKILKLRIRKIPAHAAVQDL